MISQNKPEDQTVNGGVPTQRSLSWHRDPCEYIVHHGHAHIQPVPWVAGFTLVPSSPRPRSQGWWRKPLKMGRWPPLTGPLEPGTCAALEAQEESHTHMESHQRIGRPPRCYPRVWPKRSREFFIPFYWVVLNFFYSLLIPYLNWKSFLVYSVVLSSSLITPIFANSYHFHNSVLNYLAFKSNLPLPIIFPCPLLSNQNQTK